MRFRTQSVVLITLTVVLPALLAQQKQGHEAPAVPKFPGWGRYLDGKVFIAIPLNAEGKPFTIEARITDANGGIVREFKDVAVDGPVWRKSLPPFSPGTYNLKVTVMDKTGKVIVGLDHFPAMNVPER